MKQALYQRAAQTPGTLTAIMLYNERKRTDLHDAESASGGQDLVIAVDRI